MSNLSFFVPDRLGMFGEAIRDSLVNYGYRRAAAHENPDLVINDSSTLPTNGKRNILLLMEPSSVSPFDYEKKRMSNYDKVFALSRYRAEKLGLDLWFDLPIILTDPTTQYFENRAHVVMLSAAKYSADRDAMYSLRRSVLSLDKKQGSRIHLYGDHWNENAFLETRRRFAQSRLGLKYIRTFSLKENWSHYLNHYPQHRGTLNQRLDGLNSYLASIVIENQLDYVSEKIWIYLSQGVLPIYVGPNLDHHQQYRDFLLESSPDPETILRTAFSVNEEMREFKIAKFNLFKESKHFEEMSVNACRDRFIASLENCGII
jgi:hypothetical protein